MAGTINTQQEVQEYYGKVLGSKDDLQTSACCTMESLDKPIREILGQIEDEILDKFYGCGSPIPAVPAGATVLDLGCGTGRDVYICSKLVGENGKVIGVDMTEEQLEVARKYSDSQAKRFGYAQSNVEFKQGYIEDLAAMGIADDSVDVVISNCVINLSPNKEQVLSEIFRVLKPGGELYFSDVFSGQRIPQELKEDPVLYGECLSGALYFQDFRRMLLDLGIRDFRETSRRVLDINNEEISKKIGHIEFCSITVRAFNLNSLEDQCEDYGQIAWYLGTIEESPNSFILDDHHEFITNKPYPVCGNTAAMLEETRFAPHFRILGDRSRHFGLFDCGGDSKNKSGEDAANCC